VVKAQRVLRQLADTLNECLCGSVLDSSLSGVIKCKQAGCETQWVSSTCLMVLIEFMTHSTHIVIIVSPSVRRIGARAANWLCMACEASMEARGGKRQWQ
jgi:hypothetical protein